MGPMGFWWKRPAAAACSILCRKMLYDAAEQLRGLKAVTGLPAGSRNAAVDTILVELSSG